MSESATAIRERFATELPEAIRRQKAEVDAMLGAPAQPPAEAAPTETSDEQASAAPAGGQDAPEKVEGAGEQTQPERAPPAAPSTDSETPPEKDESVAELQRKLQEAVQEAKTWKGRERKTREETDALQARIADLEARLQAALEAPKEPEKPDLAPLTAEEIDAYGQDLLDVAKRYALAELPARIEKAVAPLLARIEALEQGVGQVQAKDAKSEWDKFIERLTKRIPDWQEIDASDPFKGWLDSEDPVLGVPYRKGLELACGKLDDVRAAKVFDLFLTQTGRKSKGSQDSKPKAESLQPGTGELPTAPAQEAPGPSLEDLAAPGRPSSPQSAPVPIQPGAKVWTLAEIESYYRERAAGRHPDSRDQKKALETDTEIAMAQREGRVRG